MLPLLITYITMLNVAKIGNAITNKMKMTKKSEFLRYDNAIHYVKENLLTFWEDQIIKYVILT